TTPLKTVLLTGAGFSKPFGGYLASEMWAVIFRQRQIREFPNLRERMLKNLNFEAVYEDVMTSAPAPEQIAFTEAVWSSYVQMHDEMRIHKKLDGAGVCQRFLALSARWQARGFVFTLNQDLLIETHRTKQLPLS